MKTSKRKFISEMLMGLSLLVTIATMTYTLLPQDSLPALLMSAVIVLTALGCVLHFVDFTDQAEKAS